MTELRQLGVEVFQELTRQETQQQLKNYITNALSK